ncbi:DUF1361 domain-containing protein [Candidatus Saccharibacteria bacterium]|nr:DUF1361 domain-containing protein [Candidatus Saccharibacteria bacterium]
MRKTKNIFREYKRLILALVTANLVSLVLFSLRVIDSGGLRYWFLVWNLVLAWIPLVFAVLLSINLKKKSWSSIPNILITLMWLVFLPNSFYLVSDLIHLQTTYEVSILYDTVLFTSFIFNSYLSGFISLFIVHKELIKRTSLKTAHIIIASVLLLCSFAIYLGRVLRWNTWDIFLHPNSLLFDVSEQVVNDAAQSRASVTTLSFFVLLGGMYMVVWQLTRLGRRD